MSNILRKFRKEKKEPELDYKFLYETEFNNRKKYEKRYREKCKENIELQKGTGIAELRKQLMKTADELEKTKNELEFVKEDRAKLYVQLEDTRNELELERNKNNGE